MTFWKITDTKMNCLITQQEIKALGYNLADLTRDQEKTQEFLDILIRKGREVLGLNIGDGVQSFCGAFLPDQSLLLSISCEEIEGELDERASMRRDVPLPLLSIKGDDENPVLSYQVLFPSLDDVVSFCGIFRPENGVQSRLYENDEIYYLMLDFQNTEEGRRSAAAVISAGEFGGLVENDAISELFLQEHEKCIIEESAVEKLRSLQD